VTSSIVKDREPIVLLLNSIDHEGITSSLRTIGKDYKLKYLHSSVDNWHKAIKLFDKYDVTAVLGKITSKTCELWAKTEYKQVASKLLENISNKPNLFFIFEGLLRREEEIDGKDDLSEPYMTDLPSDEVLDYANNLLEKYKISILPYLTRAEVTISAQSFIEHVEQGLIFRVYLPSGHLWEHEIDRVLVLFRDYLSMLSKNPVRLDQVRTNQGAIYAFHTEGNPERSALSSDFEEFKEFLDLCIQNPTVAEEILKRKGVSPQEIDNIITRYSKETRRLHIDLKHSREIKLLSIKQKLESELIDYLPNEIDDKTLTQVVHSIIPPVSGITSINSLSKPSSQALGTTITVNFNQQIIDKMQGVVAHSLIGDISYTNQDRELIDLFEKYGQNRHSELMSSLNELKDRAAPKPDRVTAKQSLKKFLIGCSKKIGDEALNILLKYLESQILG
jgi:hypothetical protein